MENKRKKTEAKEENSLTFSYNLARPLFHNSTDSKDSKGCTHWIFSWLVMEKGLEKSSLEAKISFDIIERASLLKKHICKTPYDQDEYVDGYRKYDIILKKEINQHTNSVEARGVVYTLLQLSDNQKEKGVIAVSTGSFAKSLCYFGNKFKIPVTVVMPASTSDQIVNMCESPPHAIVWRCGYDMVEAHNIALLIAKERGLVYIDGNDHPNMIIGQATLGIEIVEQKEVDDIDVVILPTMVDGCGLTAGIAMAIKGRNKNVKVIKVQPTTFDPPIDPIRIKTMSHNELDIPVKEYACHENLEGIGQSLFDKSVEVELKVKDYWERNNDMQFVGKAADFLRKKHRIIDFYAEIGLAAVISGKLDELIMGRRVLIPVFGKTDFKPVTNNSSFEPRANSHGLIRHLYISK